VKKTTKREKMEETWLDVHMSRLVNAKTRGRPLITEAQCATHPPPGIAPWKGVKRLIFSELVKSRIVNNRERLVVARSSKISEPDPRYDCFIRQYRVPHNSSAVTLALFHCCPPLHHFPTSSLPMSPPPHTLTSHHCSETLDLIVILYEALSNMAKPIHGTETFQVGVVWDPAAKFRKGKRPPWPFTRLLARVCVLLEGISLRNERYEYFRLLLVCF
jgi:hypothetical protein